MLDPSIVFLNHGSFGATPRAVFEAYQKWQRELERQPVEFLGRRFNDLMRDARAALADYLHTDKSNLTYVTNATVGVNIVARSLKLSTGDEVLSTDHEYGAMDRTWRFVCQKTGARYINQRLPRPLESREQLIEALWSAVTDRTRAIFLSHITAPTALIFPIEEICQRARAAGILTVIDGAHAPGQITLDLEHIGADFYVGNCHKWMLSPKGAGFLYARPDAQALLEPLVVSWGWESETPGDSPFIDQHEWQGTRDIAAFLSVPAAIEFMRAHAWDRVRAECHALAREFRQRMTELTGLPPLSPDSPDWYAQMVALPLPDCDRNALKRRLYDDYHIEIPLQMWNGSSLSRASFQGYNTREDVDKAMEAFRALL
ncbi:MAG TPA: aminotransferase class V-fold PLP-dependent enzyme [Anaerolineae bacterium]|nr:aminotransferase class V-fold PLP-dependent enzyme [Anaerolineae bacterium]